MGNPQWVDEIVFPQRIQENVVLEEARISRSQFIQEVGAYCGQGREEKEEQHRRLASGSRECLEKPKWMSSPKLCVQLDHATHVSHYCRVPYRRRQCWAH